MINKIVEDTRQAIQGIKSGDTVLIGGFGDSGVPFKLIEAILRTDVCDLTIVSNNAGTYKRGIEALLLAGKLKKIICSYPRSSGATAIVELWKNRQVVLEVIPQGTLTERIRAGGAGLGGFYTPVGVNTLIAKGKEVRVIDGKEYLLEKPIRGDIALLKANKADRYGNLVYNKSARNFNPVMATAADIVVVEVNEIVELGKLDPESIITPGIFIDRVVLGGQK